jgi:hypothetical protein
MWEGRLGRKAVLPVQRRRRLLVLLRVLRVLLLGGTSVETHRSPVVLVRVDGVRRAGRWFVAGTGAGGRGPAELRQSVFAWVSLHLGIPLRRESRVR